MRRENKLALIVGFSVLLVVAVLVSDHLSKARQDEVADGLDTLSQIPDARAFMDAPLSDRGRVGDDARDLAESGRVDTPVTPPAAREVAQAQATPPAEPRPSATPELEPLIIENGRGGGGTDLADAGEAGTGPLGLPRGLFKELLDGRTPPSMVEPGNRSESSSRPIQGGKVEGTNKYTVRPGDTLYEICEEQLGDGTRWREVAAMNKGRVGEDGQVYVNVTLDLPAAGRRAGAPRSAPAERERVAGGSTRSYTVKKGDTLSEIVMREVGSVRYLDRVRALNPWLKDQKDSIRIGQTLTLPVI